jgi:hypothetical protein
LKPTLFLFNRLKRMHDLFWNILIGLSQPSPHHI